MIETLKSFWHSEDPPALKRKQYMVALGILGLLFFSLAGLAFWGSREERPLLVGPRSPQAKEIESSGTRMAPEEVWRFRMEAENKTLKEAIGKIQASLEAAQQDEKHRQERAAYEQKVEANLQDLQHQLIPRTAPEPDPAPQVFPEWGKTKPAPALIQKFVFSAGKAIPSVKTVKNTIPSGAFVQAVLLSGVDVSTALNASTEPRPVLLRLVDHGSLPRKFKSDLKDCHLTVGAYGDLSSERVYGRLERLTCVARQTGEIIETQVTGFVAGPDGKAGIRGRVVSKEGAFLERSFLGGLLSGLSHSVNPQNRQSLVNPFSAGNPKVDAPSTTDMISSGIGEGATSALDRLSRYYINRAEQLQPVIQVPAGQVVDVVFTQAVLFGSQRGQENGAPGQVVASKPEIQAPSGQENSASGQVGASKPETQVPFSGENGL